MTVPGPDVLLPERHPDAAPPGQVIASHYRRCFGCGVDHDGGLRMEVVAGEGLTMLATFDVGEGHQGAPGLAHGGLLVAAMDEALGALNWLLMRPAVTARLETDFRAPVPVGARLHLVGQITGVAGRKVYTSGVATLGPTGEVVLAAAGLFIQVGAGHVRQHGRAQDVDRAIAAGDIGLRTEMNP